MDIENLRLLVRVMMNLNDPLSSTDCAKVLGISAQNFRKRLADINAALKGRGVSVVGRRGRGNGYSLIVHDQGQMNAFLSAADDGTARDLSARGDRSKSICLMLLRNNGWAKGDDLAEELSVSRSQFSNDLKDARDFLGKYQIRVESKPHYGMRAVGEETDKRRCISDILQQNFESAILNTASYARDTERLKQVQAIIARNCKQAGYTLNGMTLGVLAFHLFTSWWRVRNGNQMRFPAEEKDEIKRESEHGLAQRIISDLEGESGISFHEDEICYFAQQLLSKRIISSADNGQNCEAMQIVDEVIHKVRETLDVDLAEDLNLRMMLSLHIAGLLSRIKYRRYLANPMLDEIRQNYVAAYELAVMFADAINERYHAEIPADEIGYISLNIQLSLLRERSERSRLRILLVCSSGRGSSQLLKYNFDRKYGRSISRLDVCDVVGLDSTEVGVYDAIFTTVPLARENLGEEAPPVYLVDSITHELVGLKTDDLSSLGRRKGEVLRYFPEELFIADVDGGTKEDVIHALVSKVGKIRQLPEGFEAAVNKRERLASTSFGGGVAFPHPNTAMTEDSFIAVGILRQPIEWGGQKVRVVLLASFEKGFVRKHDDVIDVVSGLIQDAGFVQVLANSPNYETFERIVHELEGERSK